MEDKSDCELSDQDDSNLRTRLSPQFAEEKLAADADEDSIIMEPATSTAARNKKWSAADIRDLLNLIYEMKGHEWNKKSPKWNNLVDEFNKGAIVPRTTEAVKGQFKAVEAKLKMVIQNANTAMLFYLFICTIVVGH